MARPLIRRRIKVSGRQRTDIDADLLLQALIQIAEDEAAQNSPGEPTTPTPAGTRPNHMPAGSRRRPTPTAPSPHRPAGRTTRSRGTARGAPGHSTSNKHRHIS